MSNTFQIKAYITFDVPVEETKNGDTVPSYSTIKAMLIDGINSLADTNGWDIDDLEVK